MRPSTKYRIGNWTVDYEITVSSTTSGNLYIFFIIATGQHVTSLLLLFVCSLTCLTCRSDCRRDSCHCSFHDTGSHHCNMCLHHLHGVCSQSSKKEEEADKTDRGQPVVFH